MVNMLWWIQVCLLMVLVPLAILAGAKALHSAIVKMKEEEAGFHG